MTTSEPDSKASRAYLAVSLRGRAETLRALAASLARTPEDPNIRAALQRELRALCDPQMKLEAATLARRCEGLLAAGNNPGDVAPKPEIEQLICEIESTIDQMTAGSVAASTPESFVEPLPRLLIVDDEAATRTVLSTIFEREGYRVETADSATAACLSIQTHAPDAIVVDIRLDDRSGLDVVDFARSHLEPSRSPFVVMLTVVGEFETKLEAVRLGADAYFQKPADWQAVARRVRQGLSQRVQNPSPSRVLVVEDDPEQGQWIQGILISGSLEVLVCRDPRSFDQELLGFQPDLILLDIHLPDVNGYELARYLRQHDRYAAVPILFISADTRESSEIQAIVAGGDDFLRKPVTPALLLATVQARLNRAASLKNLLEVDALSGALTRRSFDERIGAAVDEKRRRGQAACYSLAVLDIDNFKAINDQFGHVVGDRVINSLATFLKSRVRSSDIVARYGGDEFAVLFPNATEATARTIMEKLLADFRKGEHVSSDESTRFAVSFSAGIAELTGEMQPVHWRISADRMLYASKRLGRATVMAAAGDLGGLDVSLPVLDESTLEDLEELGRRAQTDLFTELVQLFLREVSRRTTDIRKFVDDSDLVGVERGAHAFFSAAGNIGAIRLSAVCEKLETAARAKDAREVTRLAPSLFAEALAAEDAFRERLVARASKSKW